MIQNSANTAKRRDSGQEENQQSVGIAITKKKTKTNEEKGTGFQNAELQGTVCGRDQGLSSH